MGLFVRKTTTKLVDGTTTVIPPKKNKSNGISSGSKISNKSHSKTLPRGDDLPPLPWPQAPLMMRASSSTTRVLAIRPAYDDDDSKATTKDMMKYSPQSQFLPINNGDEANPMAIDFESDLFRGTIMVRVRGAPAHVTTQDQEQQDNYFTGKQRQFQVVISGQFLRPDIRKAHLLSGQQLEQRPMGKLPGLSVVSGILKLYKTLQPTLNVELNQPSAPYAKALSPLAALAQTVLVQDGTLQSLPTDDELQEPHPSHSTNLFPDPVCFTDQYTSTNRRRQRRKQRIQDDAHSNACFDVDQTYTFDMYQHQLHLVDYTLQFAFYRLSIAPVLNGQPLRILAMYKDETVWSFELWHESLLH